MIILIFKSR